MKKTENSNKSRLLNTSKLNIKHHIYITVGIFAVIFAALIIYLFYINSSKQEYFDNSYNKREATVLKENLRGSIYSANGDVLAYSVQTEDGSQNRIYPYGALFSHVVGYSSLGKAGVEELSNYYLLNTCDNVFERAQNASIGKLNNCYNITTTLDVNIQKICDDYLGNYDGAVIVTNVKTGEILALVSHPTFDPNTIEDYWDDLIESDSSILLNRVTQGQYPPGSTFKIVTALEYYKENKNISDYQFVCNGYYLYDNYRINCFHGTVHGEVDFINGFAKSCNSSFANIGMMLDREKFSDTLSSLLFNEDLPSVFEYNKSSVLVDSNIEDYMMMQTSIGQGKTSISPYHLNLLTMAIANNGTLVSPKILKNITDSDGKMVKEYSDLESQSLMTKDEAVFLQELMEEVVLSGTATRLKSETYTSAGKTGSAEFNNNGDSHAWFTGYAPAEDPEIAVTIIVEKGGTGGTMAVPLAKLIFDYYFNN